MAGDTVITLVGNLTADPELRFTPSGAAVANFTVASTPRTFDRASGEWKDGEALFMRCNIWRQAAENVAESLTRGARVVVQGRLKQRVDAFGVLLDLVGQPATAPDVDLLDGAAGRADHVEERVQRRGDRALVERRIQDDHYLVMA